MAETTFQLHLQALSAEYSRLVAENELLKQAGVSFEPAETFRAEPVLSEWSYAPCTSKFDEAESMVQEVLDQGELDGNFQPPDAPAAERKEREAPKSPQPKATESGSGSRPADVAESRIVRLDVATALVTFLWLGFQGLSSDMNPEHGFWRFLDVMFTFFFLIEMITRLWLLGCREYLFGSDWRWGWLDILCVLGGLVDVIWVSGFQDVLLPLGRVLRLWRCGVLHRTRAAASRTSGLRVLQVVLDILGAAYLMGLLTRHVFSDLAEFSSVPNSMFTVFRCYTGDCTTTEGNSIPEVLRQQFGAVFMTSYMVFTVLLTVNVIKRSVCVEGIADGVRRLEITMGRVSAKLRVQAEVQAELAEPARL